MNINPTSAAEVFKTASSDKSAKKEESQKDMFMTLLVAQLKNQDPLAPQDGTEFVAQLTQMNSLDQLVGIRQSIDKLISYTQAGQSKTDL